MPKQYVNLPSNPKKQHGKTLKLEARVTGLAVGKPATLVWKVEPVGTDNTDLKFLARKQRARLRKKETRRTGAKKGDTLFPNKLDLPHVGGDIHRVTCWRKDAPANILSTTDYETWRKIFYTVHYMNQQCLNTFQAVQARFEQAFAEGYIEIDERQRLQTLKDEPMTDAKNAALPHLYRRKPALADKPFHLRIVVVNDLYDKETADYEETGKTVSPVTIQTDQPLVSGKRWLLRARARIEGTPKKPWRNVKRWTTRTSDTDVEIDLTKRKEFVKALAAGKTIGVNLRVRERSHYLGHSIGNFCCVRINETGTPAQIEQIILQTFTHETGHGFQQAVRRERLHDAKGNRAKGAGAWEKNAHWHDDEYGGVGPHCSTNARLVPSLDTSSSQIYEHDSGTLCTMFYRGDTAVDVDGSFCSSCLPRLERVDLGAAQMLRQGWTRY